MGNQALARRVKIAPHHEIGKVLGAEGHAL